MSNRLPTFELDDSLMGSFAFSRKRPQTRGKTRKIRVLQLVEHPYFQLLIISLVLLDIVMFFMELSSDITDAMTETTFIVAQFVVAVVFVAEASLKLYAIGWRRYTSTTTNLVDFVVVVVTTVGSVLQIIQFVQSNNGTLGTLADKSDGSMFVRLIRLLRLFRLFRIYRLHNSFIPQRGFSLSITPLGQALDVLQRVRQCLMISGEYDEFVRPTEVEWIMELVKAGKLAKATTEGFGQEELQFIQDIGGSTASIPVSQTRKRRNTHFIADPSAAVEPDNELQRLMSTADHLWNFDVFKLRDLSKNRPLCAVGFRFFHAFELTKEFNIENEVLMRWLDLMESAYQSNPYHNNTHAADVTQSLCYLIKECGFLDDFTPLQVFAAVFAAIIHDVLHPGVTNKFLIQAQHPVAMRYNDHSVLENQSIAWAFQMTCSQPRMGRTGTAADMTRHSKSLSDVTQNIAPDQAGDANHATDETNSHSTARNTSFKTLGRLSLNKLGWRSKKSGDDSMVIPDGETDSNMIEGNINILSGLSADDFREFRRLVIEMVLHTDMAQHFELIARLEAHEHIPYNWDETDDVVLGLSALLHMADISNPTKSWPIYSQWMTNVMTEFRQQGKREQDAGFPISMFMDPAGGKDADRQCQVAFIDVLALPFVKAFHKMVCVAKPGFKQRSQQIVDQLDSNRTAVGGPRSARSARSARRNQSVAQPSVALAQVREQD